MPIAFQRTTATHIQASGSTAAQTVFTFTPTANSLVKGVWLDLINLTQNAVITLAYQIDGTNFRTFQSINWNTTMEDGVLIEGDMPVGNDKGLRVQLTSSVEEASNRSVPYEYWTEGLGAGAIEFTYTVTNTITSAAIGGVEVWVTTDITGNNIIASGLTNDNGQIIFYLDNNTTFYFWRSHPDFTFVNPDTEIVSV